MSGLRLGRVGKIMGNAPPAHLITPAGWVKMALPERSASMSFQTLSAVAYE